MRKHHREKNELIPGSGKVAAIESEASSGNIFADIGLPDAEEEFLKAELAYTIGRLLNAQALTQSRAASLLGTTQPKVSLLLRGRTEGFSIQKLFGFLTRLDQDVTIAVRPKTASNARGLVMFVRDSVVSSSAATSGYRYPSGRQGAAPSAAKSAARSTSRRAPSAGRRR
jgi:predicted XRE-type DNA-binding protein